MRALAGLPGYGTGRRLPTRVMPGDRLQEDEEEERQEQDALPGAHVSIRVSAAYA